MLYIKTPENMVFQRRIVFHEGENIEMDCLVDPNNENPIINLQLEVKEVLRHRKGSKDFVTSPNGLIIHFGRPRHVGKFLQYEPQRNGKEPGTHVESININSTTSNNIAYTTRYGERWHQQGFFAKEQLAKIQERDEQVRLNRRHIGDSPLAT